MDEWKTPAQLVKEQRERNSQGEWREKVAEWKAERKAEKKVKVPKTTNIKVKTKKSKKKKSETNSLKKMLTSKTVSKRIIKQDQPITIRIKSKSPVADEYRSTFFKETFEEEKRNMFLI